jgi:hypothetical protein
MLTLLDDDMSLLKGLNVTRAMAVIEIDEETEVMNKFGPSLLSNGVKV